MISALSAMVVLQTSTQTTPTTIVKTSLFKNGYAVIVREAKVPASGQIVIEEPPVVTLGTLWITSSQGSSISRIVAGTMSKETTTQVGAKSIDEALALNKGKTVTLTMYGSNGELQTMTGTIRHVEGNLVVIDRDGSSELLLTSRIVSASINGAVYSSETKTTQNVPVLRVTATPGSSVYIMGLEAGAMWHPSYHVDITDPKNLTITSQATLVNDVADMTGIDAKLITGFPNIPFLGRPDPLTLIQGFQNQLRDQMAAGSGAFQNAAPGQAVYGRREAAGDAFAPIPEGATGVQSEDLFFYTLPKIDLKKGERGLFTLFQSKSPYDHVYCLDLGTQVAPRPGQTPNFAQSTYDVWHELEFKNQSKQPWTTGPVVAVRDGEILGQDELKYTSVGATAYLRMSKALDVPAQLVEEEIAREREALKLTYSAYDLVTYKGTVKIINRKDRPVQMRITRNVEGELIESSIEVDAQKGVKGLNSENPMTRLEWSPTVPAGKDVTFTYTVKVYMQVR